MKTFEIGNITELQVQLAFVKKGYLIFTPINDGSFIDFVVKTSKGLKSVQVKTSTKTATGYKICLYSSAGGGKHRFYSSDSLDYFATFFEDSAYLIPVKDIEGKTTVVLRTNKKYKNQNKGFFAENYILSEI